jgi:hypothetical protein
MPLRGMAMHDCSRLLATWAWFTCLTALLGPLPFPFPPCPSTTCTAQAMPWRLCAWRYTPTVHCWLQAPWTKLHG